MSQPKRPRADTQTSSSPKHNRTRVDEVMPTFTLFDGSEVAANQDSSVFDDQLSDISDTGFELPPLTPSPEGSDSEESKADGKLLLASSWIELIESCRLRIGHGTVGRLDGG
jgi:hypothetical protein